MYVLTLVHGSRNDITRSHGSARVF